MVRVVGPVGRTDRRPTPAATSAASGWAAHLQVTVSDTGPGSSRRFGAGCSSSRFSPPRCGTAGWDWPSPTASCVRTAVASSSNPSPRPEPGLRSGWCFRWPPPGPRPSSPAARRRHRGRRLTSHALRHRRPLDPDTQTRVPRVTPAPKAQRSRARGNCSRPATSASSSWTTTRTPARSSRRRCPTATSSSTPSPTRCWSSRRWRGRTSYHLIVLDYVLPGSGGRAGVRLDPRQPAGREHRRRDRLPVGGQRDQLPARADLRLPDQAVPGGPAARDRLPLPGEQGPAADDRGRPARKRWAPRSASAARRWASRCRT